MLYPAAWRGRPEFLPPSNPYTPGETFRGHDRSAKAFETAPTKSRDHGGRRLCSVQAHSALITHPRRRPDAPSYAGAARGRYSGALYWAAR